MNIKRFIQLIVSLIAVCGALCAADGDHLPMNPVKDLEKIGSPGEFADNHRGDTIFFYVANSADRDFESFYLLEPDTVWLKERPKKKTPERENHFRLRTNYQGISGWGVNSHRFYTMGSSLENKLFIIVGSYQERIDYLGTRHFIILEDAQSGTKIKWDYSKNENTDMVMFSSSIKSRLDRLLGKSVVIEQDTALIEGKCAEISYSIDVHPSKWEPKLFVTFNTQNGKIISVNSNPKFYIPPKE